MTGPNLDVRRVGSFAACPLSPSPHTPPPPMAQIPWHPDRHVRSYMARDTTSVSRLSLGPAVRSLVWLAQGPDRHVRGSRRPLISQCAPGDGTPAAVWTCVFLPPTGGGGTGDQADASIGHDATGWRGFVGQPPPEATSRDCAKRAEKKEARRQ